MTAAGRTEQVWRAEEKNLYGKNVQYPAGFTLDDYESEAEQAIYDAADMGVDIQQDWQPNHVVVSLGPQHPSTHGVFRMVATLDGETIQQLAAGDGLSAPQPRKDRRA